MTMKDYVEYDEDDTYESVIAMSGQFESLVSRIAELNLEVDKLKKENASTLERCTDQYDALGTSFDYLRGNYNKLKDVTEELLRENESLRQENQSISEQNLMLRTKVSTDAFSLLNVASAHTEIRELVKKLDRLFPEKR